MDDINTVIRRALELSGTTGYQGTFQPLGGGEINDTYALQCDGRELILRIARYEDQKSLRNEARALSLLNVNHAPRLVFFDENLPIHNRLWILESRVHGQTVEQLNAAQFHNLGGLLAVVHQTRQGAVGVNIWQEFLKANSTFGGQERLLHHPDTELRQLVISAKNYFEHQQPAFNTVVPALVHGDATPNNILADGDSVSLIDWEFSVFNDPMAEFCTIYYDDMEYNRGRWRVHITAGKRDALFSGYRAAGGVIDTQRLDVWMIFDKLGAALYLYWRLHESGRDTTREQQAQYEFDLENLRKSLKKSLLLPHAGTAGHA